MNLNRKKHYGVNGTSIYRDGVSPGRTAYAHQVAPDRHQATELASRDKSPVDSEVKLPYLKQNRGEIRLNENHKYFTQCQVQMAATEISASYFYVWTPKGSYTQEIKFDEKLWEELKTIFYQFYANFYVPSLFQLDERTKI